MSSLRRSRTQPIKDVAVADYKNCIIVFLRTDPQVPWEMKLGPRLVRDPRAITGEAFRCVKPLLDSLVLTGLSTACMQSSKFKDALRDVLTKHPMYLGEMGIEQIIDRSTLHLMTMFKFIRDVKWEQSVSTGISHGSRTGKLRRLFAKCGMLDPLQESLDKVDAISNRGTSPASTAYYSDLEDSCDWPAWCSPSVKNPIRDSDDEWPMWCSPSSSSADPFVPVPNGNHEVNDLVQPILPSSKARKKAAFCKKAVCKRPAAASGCSKCRWSMRGCAKCRSKH